MFKSDDIADRLRACQSRSHLMTTEQKTPPVSGFILSRQNVCGWLRSIQAMPPRKPAPLDPDNDLKVLRQTIASVMDALDAEILNQDEADALIQFIAEKFISRRVEERVNCLVDAAPRRWFCIAHETERHQ